MSIKRTADEESYSLTIPLKRCDYSLEPMKHVKLLEARLEQYRVKIEALESFKARICSGDRWFLIFGVIILVIGFGVAFFSPSYTELAEKLENASNLEQKLTNISNEVAYLSYGINDLNWKLDSEKIFPMFFTSNQNFSVSDDLRKVTKTGGNENLEIVYGFPKLKPKNSQKFSVLIERSKNDGENILIGIALIALDLEESPFTIDQWMLDCGNGNFVTTTNSSTFYKIPTKWPIMKGDIIIIRISMLFEILSIERNGITIGRRNMSQWWGSFDYLLPAVALYYAGDSVRFVDFDDH